MLILLKLVSFAIWLVIMMFIIRAGLRKRKAAIPDLAAYLCKDKDEPGEFVNHRVKV